MIDLNTESFGFTNISEPIGRREKMFLNFTKLKFYFWCNLKASFIPPRATETKVKSIFIISIVGMINSLIKLGDHFNIGERRKKKRILSFRGEEY